MDIEPYAICAEQQQHAARGQHPPLPSRCPHSKNGSCLHAGHETLRETCHQATGTTCDSPGKVDYFLHADSREGGGGVGFMQSVSRLH